MGFTNSKLMQAVAAIGATAALAYFGNGMDPVWLLMWFAPLPVLLFAARSRWWAGGVAALVAWLLGCLSLEPYLSKMHIPWLMIAGAFALAFTAAVMLFAALLRRGAAWGALVVFPAAWVMFEYALDRMGTGGTAGSLAYTQLKFLPFLQLASVTGPWGMSFVLMMVPAAVAIGWTLRRSAPRTALRIASVGLGVLAVVLVCGAVRVARPQPGERVMVGLIAADSPGGVADPGAATQKLFEGYAAVADKLAAEGAQAIVMPENLGIAGGQGLVNTDALFQGIADRTGATVVVGMDHVTGAEKQNEARIYAPHTAVASYDKEHLLRPYESFFTPGTTLATLRNGSGTWAVAICKDLDFSQPARTYGEQGAGLLLAPAWDFDMDRTWHGHIAIMRGVEDGFSLARVARRGFLTVSDDRGRVLAETRSDSAPFAMLLARVPVGHERTVYLQWGDWFVAAAGVLLVAAIVMGFGMKRRK